jgi:hypothetical protein
MRRPRARPGVRRPPLRAVPWYVAGNVQPFAGFAGTVVEGVY